MEPERRRSLCERCMPQGWRGGGGRESQVLLSCQTNHVSSVLSQSSAPSGNLAVSLRAPTHAAARNEPSGMKLHASLAFRAGTSKERLLTPKARRAGEALRPGFGKERGQRLVRGRRIWCSLVRPLGTLESNPQRFPLGPPSAQSTRWEHLRPKPRGARGRTYA